MSGGHRPKEIFEWPKTERELAAKAALELEKERLKAVSKMLGG